MKFKLTKQEKGWVLYDVGNSAFVLLISTIMPMPIYFNYLAGNAGLSDVDYLAYWGYAASIATIIVALIGPVLGTMADTKDYKKPLFTIMMLIGAVGCMALGFAKQWLIFLIIFVIAKCGFSASLIFYDSMLGDVTNEERLDNISSLGYAWGYLGSCIPFVACLGLVLGSGEIGISMELAMGIAFAIVALWWFFLSVPILKNYKQKYYVEKKPNAVRESFSRLGKTFANVKKEKKVFLFLLAFFFYIDGVYTIIDMATAYGTSLGLDSTSLLLALLVGMFQGGIQALSGSYFTKIIPANQSGEYFGLMDICGKGASFIGTTVVSVVSQLTGSVNMGVGMIAIMFVIGMVVFRAAVSTGAENAKKENTDAIETVEVVAR